MTFIEMQNEFEARIYKPFELLESHHSEYAFGSGWLVYRINGKNIKLIFDGRDEYLTIQVSPKHIKYPTEEWKEIIHDKAEKIFSTYFNELKAAIEI